MIHSSCRVVAGWQVRVLLSNGCKRLLHEAEVGCEKCPMHGPQVAVQVAPTTTKRAYVKQRYIRSRARACASAAAKLGLEDDLLGLRGWPSVWLKAFPDILPTSASSEVRIHGRCECQDESCADPVLAYNYHTKNHLQ
jgi:hypothetical protein